MVSEGESTNESRPALRLVKIDPLHLRTPEAAARVRELDLELGDPAWVILNLGEEFGPEQEVRQGKVIAISPVTETGSQKLIVKVEVPNPGGVTAGLLAWVRFEPPEDEYWKSKMAEADGGEAEKAQSRKGAEAKGGADTGSETLTSEQVGGTLAGDGA